MATVKKTANKPLPPGPGRPKGAPNKTTATLKEAILIAAENAGGKDGLVGYLQKIATKNPAAFVTLLGKVLPLQVTGPNDGPVQFQRSERVIVDPSDSDA